MARMFEPEMNTCTFLHFNTVNSVSADVDDAALNAVEALCAKYEQLFNRFNPASQLYALNHARGEWARVDAELAQLLRAALGYCERTGGLFDITMGGVCSLWDFHRGVVPQPAALAAARAHVNWRVVEVRDGGSVGDACFARITDSDAWVDLGGIAKGFIADGIVRLLRERGATRGIVNLGGNVVCLGEKQEGQPWQVGLRKPVPAWECAPEESFAVVSVRDKSVVTSGVYERWFMRDGRFFHHILDPATGSPAQTDVLSATVISDASIDGDGYTTALVIMGIDRALDFVESLPGVDAVLLASDGTVYATSGVRNGKIGLRVLDSI